MEIPLFKIKETGIYNIAFANQNNFIILQINDVIKMNMNNIFITSNNNVIYQFFIGVCMEINITKVTII
jgi:hypothetical protein